MSAGGYMKAYISYDNWTERYTLSTESPATWAGVDSEECVEVDLPSDLIQKHLSIQNQWAKTQESLDNVFMMRVEHGID